MRVFKRALLLAAAWAGVSIFILGGAWGQDLPDKATLSANRMRFDSTTGDFLAEGNVRIVAGGLTVLAPRGTGNVDRREVLFNDGITASGDWMGDPVDLRAGTLSLSFAETPSCRFQGGVLGSVGALGLDADRLTLIGAGGISEPKEGDQQTKFWVVKARRLEDRSQGIALGAEDMEGVLRGGELQVMTAKRSVWLRGRPKGEAEAVNIKGNHAIYSKERGSVVLSGNVSAVQGGRTLKSDSIVYFPAQNRVEALGGVTRRDGTPETERAEITIDLSREKGARPPQRDKAPEPQKQPRKRGRK